MPPPSIILPASSGVFTTTVFPNPYTPPPTPSVTHPVPVGAIAGGVAAGAFIAIAFVVAWSCWGRAIKRSQEKHRKQADAIRTVQSNTIRNASSTPAPRAYSYMPVFARPAAKKVKFAMGVDDDELHPGTASATTSQAGNSPGPSSRRLSRPRALRPGRLSGTTDDEEPVDRRQPRFTAVRAPTFIPHKQFATSSTSPYRSQSREEPSAQTNVLLAALGHLGLDGRRLSQITRSSISIYSTGPTRLSQASSGSAYSQPDNALGVPIGFAYGGEE